jgi:hypothetical protein
MPAQLPRNYRQAIVMTMMLVNMPLSAPHHLTLWRVLTRTLHHDQSGRQSMMKQNADFVDVSTGFQFALLSMFLHKYNIKLKNVTNTKT